MNKQQNKYSMQDQVEESLNLRGEIEKYLIHWKWFVLSGFLALVLSFLYLRYTTPQYEVSSTVLIKEDESSFSSELSAFEDLGLLGGKSSNIDNEIQILKSRSLALEFSQKMDFNIAYFEKGRVKESEIYGNANLIQLKVKKKGFDFHEIDTTFYIHLSSETEFELLDIDKNKISSGKYTEEFNLEDSKFYLEKRNFNFSKSIGKDIRIQILPFEKVVTSIVKSIAIAPVDKQSSVLKLSMKHSVKKKAEDIINALVDTYNENTILDKSEVGENTSAFINKRLATIKAELGEVDAKAELYKKANNLTDIEEEAKQFFETVSESEKAIFETSTQLKLVEFMKAFIEEQGGDFELFPANLGFSDPSITVLTAQYNEIALERKRILRNSSLQNPLVENYEYQLKSYQKSLKQSLSNLNSSLQIRLEELSKNDEFINDKISNIPRKEREYKNIARQQQIKEAIYLYLLQKQEETEISLAVTTANAKVIDRAYGASVPVSPKRKIILLAGLLLGLLIPFSMIYLKDLLDTKLHTRRDLEQNVSAPILGDIPFNESGENIVVKTGGRSSVAEAFRLLRTNLNFLLTGVDENCKSIFVTSTTSGEGKSFVSVNLACTLALSGKKVALVGMDLRAPKITEYLGLPNTKGITNYIMDASLEIEDLKVLLDGHDGLEVYPSGVIPPNPAELLMNPRVEELFAKLKKTYDFIVIDTAPISLVTDTLMVSKYADMFIYVTRANYLDKRLLGVPENLYQDKRLPNMAMLINGSDQKRTYGYGTYGGYGGYGGYGYGGTEKQPWWKSIFKA
ncbi:GumC family protein [Bacteroidota bacterium]